VCQVCENERDEIGANRFDDAATFVNKAINFPSMSLKRQIQNNVYISKYGKTGK